MSTSKSLVLENWAFWWVQNFNKDDKNQPAFIPWNGMHFPTAPGMTPACASCENGQRSPGARCRISVPAVDEPLCPEHCVSHKILLTSNRQSEKATQRNTLAVKRCKYIWKAIIWFKIWIRVAFKMPIFHVYIQPNHFLYMCHQYLFFFFPSRKIIIYCYLSCLAAPKAGPSCCFESVQNCVLVLK